MGRRTAGLQQAPWVIVAGGIHRLGGTDKANFALAEYLLQQGIDVYALTHRIDDDLAQNQNLHLELVPIPGGSRFAGERLLARKGRRLARKVLDQHPRARVLVNGGNCVWTDLNWVHCVHHAWESEVRGAPWVHRLKHQVAKSTARYRELRSLRSAGMIIANSQLTRRHVIDFINVNPSRVQTIYLGAESGWDPPTEDERLAARSWIGSQANRPLVVFVGALGYDSRKGMDVLWQAWQRVCRFSEWDANLLIAGEGRALSRWRAEVSESRLSNRVSFMGFTDRIRDVLAAADLLVSPVRYESFGLNVQEALCRGVPAIVSANAGVAERYSSQLRDLLLPDPEDVDDLTRRMLLWRSNMSHWREQACQMSKTLRAYTWGDMAEQFYTLATHGSPNLCGDGTPFHG
jgi:glycosyltransferase involved in cell wall biosynthesis